MMPNIHTDVRESRNAQPSWCPEKSQNVIAAVRRACVAKPHGPRPRDLICDTAGTVERPFKSRNNTIIVGCADG